jgi:hypothetical protein
MRLKEDSFSLCLTVSPARAIVKKAEGEVQPSVHNPFGVRHLPMSYSYETTF